MKKAKKENFIRKRERAERFKTSVFIVPGFLGVLVFFIIPFFIVMYYSVIDNVIDPDFVWFKNFTSLFKNGSFRLAAKNTAIFTGVSLPLAIVIPLLLASVLMNKIPGKSLFRTVLISPLMVPTASVILIFEVLFNYNGALNAMLVPLGFEAVDWLRGEFSRYIVVILYLWKNIGYNMILFMAALAAIPRDMVDAASIDGASGLRLFFRIKLPYVSSTIVFVGLLSIINSFKVFREVYLLTGNYPNENLYMLQHFMNNTFDRLDYQKMSSAAIVLCVVMIAIIGLLMWIDNKFGKDLDAG